MTITEFLQTAGALSSLTLLLVGSQWLKLQLRNMV